MRHWIAAAVLTMLAIPFSGHAQAPAPVQVPVPAPASPDGLWFDVASVKPNEDVNEAATYTVRPNGLILANLPLRQIISLAYDLGLEAPGWRLVGGSLTLMASRFTINANTERPSTPSEIRVMLRALLADRFGLRLHQETRQGPVFALMRLHQDRLGKDLRPTQAPECKPSPMSLEFLGNLAQSLKSRCPSRSEMKPSGAVDKVESGTMAVLIDSLATVVTSRPIVDATGLRGMYEWRLRYQMLVPDPDAPAGAPSVLDALPEQLGLTLEPRTGPVDVLVIDRMDRLTPD